MKVRDIKSLKVSLEKTCKEIKELIVKINCQKNEILSTKQFQQCRIEQNEKFILFNKEKEKLENQSKDIIKELRNLGHVDIDIIIKDPLVASTSMIDYKETITDYKETIIDYSKDIIDYSKDIIDYKKAIIDYEKKNDDDELEYSINKKRKISETDNTHDILKETRNCQDIEEQSDEIDQDSSIINKTSDTNNKRKLSHKDNDGKEIIKKRKTDEILSENEIKVEEFKVVDFKSFNLGITSQMIYHNNFLFICGANSVIKINSTNVKNCYRIENNEQFPKIAINWNYLIIANDLKLIWFNLEETNDTKEITKLHSVIEDVRIFDEICYVLCSDGSICTCDPNDGYKTIINTNEGATKFIKVDDGFYYIYQKNLYYIQTKTNTKKLLINSNCFDIKKSSQNLCFCRQNKVIVIISTVTHEIIQTVDELFQSIIWYECPDNKLIIMGKKMEHTLYTYKRKDEEFEFNRFSFVDLQNISNFSCIISNDEILINSKLLFFKIKC